jgi:hypothetical protein
MIKIKETQTQDSTNDIYYNIISTIDGNTIEIYMKNMKYIYKIYIITIYS